MMNEIIAIITRITTNPTLSTLIIGFVLFISNEYAKRRYLVHEKLYSLRLDRFESLLQELYTYFSIYLGIRRIVLPIKIVDISIENQEEFNKTKLEIANLNQYFEKLYSKTIINENDIIEAKTPDDLIELKLKLWRFLQLEGAKISLNIQYKISSLDIIITEKTIQSEARKIAKNIHNYINESDENKDYTESIQDDIKELVNSMQKSLKSNWWEYWIN